MGEHHTVRQADGTIDYACKLGTCDDWHYVRREEAVALQPFDVGEDADIAWALREESLLWRFPFPWEDGSLDHQAIVSRIDARNMETSLTLAIDRAFTLEPAFFGTFKHDVRRLWIEAKGGGNTITMVTPCPLDTAWAEKGFIASDPSPVVFICGERYDAEGRGRTVFACGYCEAMFSIGPHELPRLRESLLHSFTSLEGVEELARRITPRA